MGGGAGLGALMAFDPALADTRFVNFTFPATGAPTPRTMPDRLAEIINVKDYGALGNGSDATTAFQNALNAAVSTGNPMYIPAGNYVISAALTFNTDANFGLWVSGSGYGTFISAGFSGYIFDRHLATPNNTYGPRIFENMRIANTAGGCFRIGSTIGATVRQCNISSSGTSIDFEDAPGSSSENVLCENNLLNHSGTVAGSKSIVLGGSGCIAGCDLTSTDKSLILYGGGISVFGCRMERNNTAITLGVDSAGTDRGLHGVEISGMPMEGNWTFIEIAGTTTGFKIGPMVFTGHDSTNSGVTPGIMGSQYGILIRADKAYAGKFIGIGAAQYFDIGGFYIEDYTTRSYVTFQSCTTAFVTGAPPWRLSTYSAGFNFVNCNIGANSNAPSGSRYTFSNLPNMTDRLEGDIYDISDGSTGTIGSNVSGSGANRCRVRWNGTNWICIGG